MQSWKEPIRTPNSSRSHVLADKEPVCESKATRADCVSRRVDGGLLTGICSVPLVAGLLLGRVLSPCSAGSSSPSQLLHSGARAFAQDSQARPTQGTPPRYFFLVPYISTMTPAALFASVPIVGFGSSHTSNLVFVNSRHPFPSLNCFETPSTANRPTPVKKRLKHPNQHPRTS